MRAGLKTYASENEGPLQATFKSTDLLAINKVTAMPGNKSTCYIWYSKIYFFTKTASSNLRMRKKKTNI